ncbi:MAG: 4-demethylwyosine synthase TYW1 [Candidatus Hadarchaeaceae archaeon]
MLIPPDRLSELEKAGYRFVGRNLHGAVKVCHWTRKSLLNRGFCYKQKFYGVQSHRCLQLAPSLPFCDHRCIFCWRNTEITSPRWVGGIDEPSEILDGAITAQQRLISGFGGNPEVDRRKFSEAMRPKHCAISLAGEPTLYPKINNLIEECRRRGMSSFLVSNGQHPEVLENMVEPTQLYISLVAPDPEVYKVVCRPALSDGWIKLMESLRILSSFSCRRVIRMTLVKGLNFRDPQSYAKIISHIDADFVEVKAYMCVGYSRNRLGLDNMPLHSEIAHFARAIAAGSGYKFSDEVELSRVVLLSRR